MKRQTAMKKRRIVTSSAFHMQVVLLIDGCCVEIVSFFTLNTLLCTHTHTHTHTHMHTFVTQLLRRHKNPGT